MLKKTENGHLKAGRFSFRVIFWLYSYCAYSIHKSNIKRFIKNVQSYHKNCVTSHDGVWGAEPPGPGVTVHCYRISPAPPREDLRIFIAWLFLRLKNVKTNPNLHNKKKSKFLEKKSHDKITNCLEIFFCSLRYRYRTAIQEEQSGIPVVVGHWSSTAFGPNQVF